MGTRSFIGKSNPDKSITTIYCHFDGCPEHNGKILIDNYITEEMVDSLLAGGDMSSLGVVPHMCDTYRARGERGVDARIYTDFDTMFNGGVDSWVEFFYVYEDGVWRCWNRQKEIIDLTKLE